MKLRFFLLLIIQKTLYGEPIQEFTVRGDRASSLSTENAFSSSFVITNENIRTKQYRTVYEALKDIPGVDTFSTAPGQVATVFIRGEKSEQTLVLIDGVEYNDPTDPGRSADLGVLQMENVERIEVIRGASSVLYPGMGSVINIITKDGKGKSSLLLEIGSFGTIRSELSVRGVTESKIDYALSVGAFRTEGISASSTGTEKDGARNTTVSSNIRKTFSDKTTAALVFRFFDSKTDIDKVPADTPNNRSSQQNMLSRLSVSHPFEKWTPTLAFSLRTIDRDSIDDGSIPNVKFLSEGDIEKLEWMNEWSLYSLHTVTAGLLSERQHANTRSNFTGTQVFMNRAVTQSTALVQYEYSQDDGFAGTAGARVDYHSSFYFQPTFRLSPKFAIKNTGTTLKSAVGTGFKAPSIYQLYGEYGTPSLKAEKAISVDAGVEQSLLNGVANFAVTGFYNKLTDMVDFNFTTNRYENVGKAWTGGIEVSQSVRLFDYFRLSSAYTYLETKDELTGLTLLRRPRNRITNSLTFQNGSWDATLTHLLVGERTDVDSVAFTRKRVPEYNLFHLASSYAPWEGTRFFARIENLFDTKYQAIDGYGTPGLSIYCGVKQDL